MAQLFFYNYYYNNLHTVYGYTICNQFWVFLFTNASLLVLITVLNRNRELNTYCRVLSSFTRDYLTMQYKSGLVNAQIHNIDFGGNVFS